MCISIFLNLSILPVWQGWPGVNYVTYGVCISISGRVSINGSAKNLATLQVFHSLDIFLILPPSKKVKTTRYQSLWWWNLSKVTNYFQGVHKPCIKKNPAINNLYVLWQEERNTVKYSLRPTRVLMQTL